MTTVPADIRRLAGSKCAVRLTLYTRTRFMLLRPGGTAELTAPCPARRGRAAAAFRPALALPNADHVKALGGSPSYVTRAMVAVAG